jgi:hypothetical protein
LGYTINDNGVWNQKSWSNSKKREPPIRGAFFMR